MLKKIKKFIVVAATTITLAAGFATISPQAASAHWADTQMNWALNNGYVTADMRDSLATRQDAWLIMTRAWNDAPGIGLTGAHNFAKQLRIAEDGRPTNWVTREEMATFLYNLRYIAFTNKPWPGFGTTSNWAARNGIFDGSRPQAFATRGEVVTMIYRANKKGLLQPLN
ncbi:protein phosphatase 2C [Bacillus tropicus]|uniref:protein phosphatase 2C n=1 Tax=Bacillus tropicus TaxID=2026188 RepID=UPI002DBE50DC|nr:protein phosphatase 2C [Bacillus tropicus]MEC3467685.1 protein phosphatase 2C [Bacillus tropicus]